MGSATSSGKTVYQRGATRNPYSVPTDKPLLSILKEQPKELISDEDRKALRAFLRKHNMEANTLTQQAIRYQQQLDRLQNQRKEILNKISEIAGARLKSNNPAIADLSDQNRPSKLAEKFSELYDNEWTDATEELKRAIEHKEKSEEKLDIIIIRYLYNFTKAAYDYCKSKSEDQLKAVKEAVSLDISMGMPVELERKCQEFIRANSELTLHEVIKKQEDILTRVDTVGELNVGTEELKKCKHVQKFFRTCIQLCWMMNIQDPRVHMVTKDDSTQMYRAYTRSGDVIDYVVWPSLLLYEDGPLLYKGVAQLKKTSQPIKKETSKSKIPTGENSSYASNQELPTAPVSEYTEITSEPDSQKSNGSKDNGKKEKRKSNGSQEDSKKEEDTAPKHKSNGSQEDRMKKDTAPKPKSSESPKESKKEEETASKPKFISVVNVNHVKNAPSDLKMDQV
ncbi:uncharacterized protein LOC111126475 isoform X2 [Crassostrea virginica]